ncbi:MAG: helix-turn-helix transcriptional regulator [Bacilli bacterium]|nr:helix-turn-helix transcriptional regulator [Bacilli bacterium]
MITELGKILRIIRINTGDSMRTMADKFTLSSSYLSAIENGKRNVPNNFEDLVVTNYDLTDKDVMNLRNAINATAGSVRVDLTELSDKKKKVLFALTKDDLDDDAIDELCEIIEKRK